MEWLMAEKRQNIIEAVGTYGKQLLGFIKARVSNEQDAEDILQDVWYQYSNLNEIGAIESVSGWLYKVAKNKITDRFRRKKPEHLENYVYENDNGEVIFREMLTADNQTPEDSFFKKVFREQLMQALEELPQKQRDVFIKNEIEELSLKEIAESSGENIKTIISRKGYAVKFLRERLAEFYKEILND